MSWPSMTPSFSFGFGNADIEEVVDETVDVGPSHGTLENTSVAAIPKLHNLQDLVRYLTL